MRFYLGVGRYTPNDAVAGEMAWKPTSVRQWKNVGLYWSKLAAMENSGLLFGYTKNLVDHVKIGCILFRNFSQLIILGSIQITVAIQSSRRFVADFENTIYENFVTNWSARINSNVDTSGRGRNKLHSYKTLKQNYIIENYCKIILPVRHRAAFSKFRCGVAPIRIETGRYESLPEEARLCPFCNVLENEMDVIMNCRVYDDLREPLLAKAVNCNPTFSSLFEVNQFVFIFSSPDLVRICAKTCVKILQRRHTLT